MQFFPADIFGPASGLPSPKLGSGKGASNIFGTGATSGSASFQDVFASLSAYNENNTPGAALTTRSTRDDRSFFKSDEFAQLKGSLTGLGVSEKVVDEYFAYMAAQKGSNPTISDMFSAANALTLNERFTAGLSKQEFVQLSGTLGKLGFSTEEINDFEQMMHSGNTLGMLKKLKDKVAALEESGKDIEIGKEELDVIIKACDILADYRDPILSAWESNFGLDDDGKLTLNKKNFDKLFGTTIAAYEKREADLHTLAQNLDEAIEAMLAYRSTKNNEPVADARGSALSERTEAMARIIATMLAEEDEEREENSTSHLIDDKKPAKATGKDSVAASLADDKMTSKAFKEERQAQTQAGIRGEASDKGAAARANTQAAEQAARQNASGQEAAERAGVENTPREGLGANEKTRQEAFKDGNNHNGAENAADSRADKAAFSTRVQEAPGAVFSLFGQTENSSSSAHSAQAAKTEIYHERIFDQIERGIIKNATDGSKQIVLRLDPPELGKLTLSLTMAQGEVKALIRTESSATTQVVSEQLAQLKQSLEEQGFKVSSLEVETRAQSHAGTDNWSGAEQHNQEREALEQARFLRLARTRAKEGDTLAQSMQHMEQPASISASGLHIIA